MVVYRSGNYLWAIVSHPAAELIFNHLVGLSQNLRVRSLVTVESSSEDGDNSSLQMLLWLWHLYGFGFP